MQPHQLSQETNVADSPETALLFRAVIAQAISDARSMPAHGRKPSSAAPSAVDSATARDWLTEGRKDFRLICTLAGLDHEAVRDQAMKLKKRGWPPIPSGTNVHRHHRKA